MAERPFAEYAARNAGPILEILKREFRDCSNVLEIGSGTGQHAVTFAAALPHLHWQTSDLEAQHAGIRAWLREAGGDNVGAPISLDVRTATLTPASFDAVFSANTAHIMDIEAVRAMFSLAGKALRTGGVFCLYGPFRSGGTFNTPSNEAFHASLRRRDPSMGIRDLETLTDFGRHSGLTRCRWYAVPSNNYVAVWKKESE